MLRKGKLVVFLGPVGVGKSTMIKCLAQMLSAKGFRVVKTSIKSYHGLSYIIWLFVDKLLKAPKGYAPWYNIPKILGLKKISRVLATISAYHDALLFIPIKCSFISLLNNLGFYVLSEEYTVISFLDYLFSWKDLKPRITFPLKILYILNVRLKPDIVFFLDAKLNVLEQRWLIRGYGDSQKRYVSFQRRTILPLCKEFKYNYITIDTSHKSIKDLYKIIKDNL